MAGNLGLEGYGYGANAGDPAGFWREAYNQRLMQQLMNDKNKYEQKATEEADKGLANPETAQALMALSQQNSPIQQQPQFNTPSPGQASQPSAPASPDMPYVGGYQQPSPVQAQALPGSSPMPPQGQDFSMPASQLNPPAGGPGVTRMDNIPPPMGTPQMDQQVQQQMQQQGQQQFMQPQQAPNPQAQQQQAMQSLMQQFPTPAALIQAVQRANPNMSPAGLSTLIKQVIPMYQGSGNSNPMSQMLAMRRLQDAEDKATGGGIYAAPSEAVKVASDLFRQTGNPAYLSRLPPADRYRILQQAGAGGTDIAGNAQAYKTKGTEAGAAAKQAGPLDFAAAGFTKIMPKALKASAAVPRDSWKFANQVGNWLKEQAQDPAFADFQAFNLGLVREYGRGMGGTVSAQQHAEEVLGTAKSPQAYAAAVKTLNQELQLAKEGGQSAIGEILGGKAKEGAPVEEAPGGEPESIKIDGTAPAGGKDHSNLW